MRAGSALSRLTFTRTGSGAGGAEAQVRITDAAVIKGDLPASQRWAVLA